MRGSNFKYLVYQGLNSAWHNRVMSFASFCILMVSLLLVGFTTLVTQNIDIIISNIEDKNQTTIFMNEEATEEDVAAAKKLLENDENIGEVIYISKDQALSDMIDKVGSNAATLFEGLEGENIMPDTFQVRIIDITKMDETISRINKINNLDLVKVPENFADSLIGIKRTLSAISFAVVVALVTVCLVIISNTTRASIFARRREINIMKYVGATNSFIRIPFFVEGMFIGLLSAVTAWLLTWLGYNSLFELFADDEVSWSIMGVTNIIPFEDVRLKVLIGYSVIGMGIGAFGSVLSLKKHMKV